MTCPIKPGNPGNDNGSNDDIVIPEIPGNDNESNNDNTIPDLPGDNNQGESDDTIIPEVPGDNNESNDTVVPDVPEDGGSNDDTIIPDIPEDNNGNDSTVTPEKPGDTEENKPSISDDTVNINGLSKLPEKYSISIQSSAENKILELMNEKRVQAGLKPLTMDNTLLQVARYKSNHMIQYNYFDHTNPDGTKWTTWLQTIGYKYNTTGENIAYNTYDPVKLFEQWWNSQGHRENMMNPSYTKVGVGVIYDKDNNKYMGTQTFSN